MQFEYESQPGRVVFGVDAVTNILGEIKRENLNKVLIITTRGRIAQAERVAELLGERCVGIYDNSVQHVPVEIVKSALLQVKKTNVDGIVAIGGGSSIGLAKAIALKTALPIIAIPTTYAGSEMTSIWGMTEGGRKITGIDPLVKAKVVIYDPKLTVNLPINITVTSALNAMAHCVAGLYAKNANPVTSLLAENGIEAFQKSLPKLIEDSMSMDARSEALYGTWLAGTVLGSVHMSLHHKLCHVIGGTCGLSHAETHSVMLPYVLSYNADHIPDAIKVLSHVFESNENDVSGALFDFSLSLGVPMSLEEIGMKKEEIEVVVNQISELSFYNPRPIEKQQIREMLKSAYQGIRPTV
ncbi:maleylacetate reductase [Halalkalibacter nanhaiisediminis]|uniref:Alcohol dehydrogenase class IV n=1 Tax=Halalkalibacter nanhaiisediminis TaxID=688079 RepID=A0A562QEW4_9BACI|nr:maleylacetate reductase [Halalkalibacter nanhaiisediminis]TWI54710.1 alcohol dehydrogenase class IV [Halalkalibacter nanhaiisediminis]